MKEWLGSETCEPDSNLEKKLVACESSRKSEDEVIRQLVLE